MAGGGGLGRAPTERKKTAGKLVFRGYLTWPAGAGDTLFCRFWTTEGIARLNLPGNGFRSEADQRNSVRLEIYVDAIRS
jgi:hypothetical protein